MSRPRGFTLIELMLVMALSTIGLLGYLSVQRIAIQGNTTSRGLNEALALAQDRLEQYAATPFAQLPPLLVTIVEPPGGLPPLLDAQGQPNAVNGSYTRTTTVTPGVGITTISVQVQFTDTQLGTTHAVTVSTIRGS